MDVSIKRFNVNMEVKNAGIEFEVRDTGGAHLGDLILTKAKLIWCPGRVRRDNGKEIAWNDFIQMMQSRP
jgi:hypothetical protein